MCERVVTHPAQERTLSPFLRSLWPSDAAAEENAEVMHRVAHLEGCIERCQTVMNTAAPVLNSPRCHSDDGVTALQLWKSLEAAEAELTVALSHLAECDSSDHKRFSHVMFLLSNGNVVAAQVQNLKRRVLGCLHCLRERIQHESEALTMDPVSVASLERILGSTNEISAELQERNDHYLYRALALQKVLLLSAKGEDDIMLDGIPSSQTREGRWSAMLGAILGSHGDAAERTKGKETVPDASEEGTSAAKNSKSIADKFTDLQLMNLCVNAAFAASTYKQNIVAAYDFALVLKLFAMKCHAVEELVATVLSLRLEKDKRLSAEQVVNEGELIGGETEEWLTCTLSKLSPEVLPQRFMLECGKVMPSYWISVVFVSLLWNTAFCLWRNGHVGVAYRWLCAVDVERLRPIAAAAAEDEGDGTSTMCGPLAWQYIVQHGSQCDSKATQEEEFTKSEISHSETQRPSRLRHLLRRVACLRDLCALLLHSATPEDVLYLLLHLDNALKWQRRRMVHDGHVAQRGEDATADVLAVVLILIEHYLSRRAVQFLHSTLPPSLSLSLPESAPMTVDAAVRHASDELISFLSGNALSGIDELEQKGVPLSWHVRYDDENDDNDGNNTVPGENNTRPLGPTWLTVQVFGMTQAFVSGFRSSDFFKSALSIGEQGGDEHLTSQETATNNWTIRSVAFPSSVQGTSDLFTKGVGSVWGVKGTDVSRLTEADKQRKKQQEQQCFLGSLLAHQYKTPKSSAAGSAQATLWFPSQQESGVSLLSGETVSCGHGDKSNEVSLRLLVIACRYSDIQALVPLRHQHEGESSGELLQYVIPELNKAVDTLVSELSRRVEHEWLTAWRCKRDQSASRACTASLLEALVEGLQSCDDARARKGSSVTAVYGAHRGSGSAQATGGDTLAGESPGDDGSRTVGGDSEPADVCELPSSAYVPSLDFDFSAFSSSSPEALWATRQLVEELERQQEIVGQSSAGGGDGAPPSSSSSSSTQGISVLTPAARQLLHEQLPVACQFLPWRLIYSTRFHGLSYSAMIGSSQRAADAAKKCGRSSPMLLVLELVSPTERASTVDDKREKEERIVIGAYLSDALHLGTRRFYGTSETFVYQLLLPASSGSPQLKTYRATRANQHFINCSSHSLAIGGGGGCSIFLLDSVMHGSTAACATFASPPLTLWSASLTSNVSRSADTATSEGVGAGASAISYDFDVKTAELLVLGG
ncbi:conserved TLD domain protein [Trypanosoma grayi]|uniref:conserved TLD domain protein n=1 Tax=Trypanosoma grayi TaxID=71804 RepID=UPI0004F47342|nr:conserved TLD domain protein [Trypanosoma grayi]KEG15561.1 conserved TLD domain protein [Trypanosoma grayi]